MNYLTLPETIKIHARQRPEKAAILAPGREALNYAELVQQIDYVRERLNTWGIGREDRATLQKYNATTLLTIIEIRLTICIKQHSRALSRSDLACIGGGYLAISGKSTAMLSRG